MDEAKPNEFRRRVSGKVPMVHLFGAAYSSDYLRRHPELQGCVLLLTLDPGDMNTLEARTVEGVRLPSLEVNKLPPSQWVTKWRLEGFARSAKAAKYRSSGSSR